MEWLKDSTVNPASDWRPGDCNEPGCQFLKGRIGESHQAEAHCAHMSAAAQQQLTCAHCEGWFN